MSIVLASCLLGAASAAVPEIAPMAVTAAGSGRALALYDLSGEKLSTREALVWLEDPALTQAYGRHHTARTVGAFALWIGGGVAVFAAVPMSGFAEKDALQLGGAALIGGGFAVQFLGPGRRLGDWVDRPRVDAAIAARAAAPTTADEAGASEESVERLHAELARHTLRLGERGQVLDAHGEIVPIGVFALRVGDTAIAEAWRVEHARYRRTWEPLIWGGGAMMTGGAALTGIGAMMNAHSEGPGPESAVPVIGFVTGLAGAGLLTGGLVGWLNARREVDDIGHWYDADGLPRRIRGYNDHVRDRLGLPPEQEARVHVELVITPSAIGVMGTF